MNGSIVNGVRHGGCVPAVLSLARAVVCFLVAWLCALPRGEQGQLPQSQLEESGFCSCREEEEKEAPGKRRALRRRVDDSRSRDLVANRIMCMHSTWNSRVCVVHWIMGIALDATYEH